MKEGELRDCDSWWRGPECLMTWPTKKVIDKPTENDELKRLTGYQLKSKAEPNGTNGYTQLKRHIQCLSLQVTITQHSR